MQNLKVKLQRSVPKYQYAEVTVLDTDLCDEHSVTDDGWVKSEHASSTQAIDRLSRLIQEIEDDDPEIWLRNYFWVNLSV